MKILMVGWELPPFNSGGLGVACFHLAKELSKKIDLTFTLPSKLPITSVPFKVIFASNYFKKNLGYIEAKYFFNDSTYELVFSYGERILAVYREKPDIVHGHDWLSLPATFFLKEYFNVPALLHVHSTEIERTGNSPNPIIFDIEINYFQKVDYLLPVSDLTKEILIKIYHIPENKIFTLPNGFEWGENPSRLPSYLINLKKEGWQIVLFVGRLVLQKGPDYLLQTIPWVKKVMPKTKFIFVGSGDMFPYLIKLANELAVQENVIFTNFLRNKELWGIYQISDVLVVPSVADPFGLVPLEGVNQNIPVIISKTTGVGCYLNHILKFDFWDIKEMANKIIGILKYKNLKNCYLWNLRSEAQLKFDWSKTANNLCDFYQKIFFS